MVIQMKASKAKKWALGCGGCAAILLLLWTIGWVAIARFMHDKGSITHMAESRAPGRTLVSAGRSR